MNNLSQHPHCIIITHVLKVDIVHLQEHVARLNASVSSHCTALHDGADVDSSIALLVTLPDYTNAQKIILLHV